jgi:autotransporter-associated beta strand protein
MFHPMKLPISSWRFSACALALAFPCLLVSPARAQTTLYWAGGTTNIADGTAIPATWSSLNGTWNLTTENFATNTSGTTYDPWTDGSIFSGTFAGWINDRSAVITLGSNLTVGGMGIVIDRGSATQNLRLDLNASSARTLTLGAGTVIDVRGGGSNLASGSTPNMGLRINASGTNVSMVGDDGFTKKGNYLFEIRGAHNSLNGTVNILHDSTANTDNNAPGWVILHSSGSLAGITGFNISASGYNAGGTTNFGSWGVFQVADSSLDQLNDNAVIALGGVGIFQFTGSSGSTETIGSLRLDSGGILDLSGNGNGGTLQLANGIDRANDRSQLSVRVQGNGTIGSTLNLGSSHGLGTNVLLPWLTDATRARFGMVDASNNLVWATATDVTGNVNTITNSATNYRVVGNATSFGANTNLASGAAANTLAFYRSNNGGALTVTIADTLTIGGGGILGANDNNNLDVTIAGTSSTSLTTSGGAPLYLAGGFSTSGGTLNINAPITGSMDVIKGGLGNVKFGGSNQTNTYTGTTYVNGGTLLIGKSTGVNSISGNVVIRSGGTLDLDNTDQIANTSTVTIENGGYFKTDGFSETIANLEGGGMVIASVSSGQSASLNMTSAVAPGDGGIGTLILDRGGAGTSIFRMNNSANFTMELSASGSAADRIDFYNYASGEFVLVGNNNLNLSLFGNQTDGRYTVSLFRFFSNNGTTATNSGLTSGLTVGTTGTIIGTPIINYNAGGSTIDLSYSVGAMYYTESGTTYTVTSAQSYNANTYIRNGATLNATVAGVLPLDTPTNLIMDDTGTGSSNFILGANQTAASLAGAASSMVNVGSNTFTIGTSSGSTTFAGNISGNGNLVKTGASTQVLTGNNSAFTGAIAISAGTLSFNGSPALGSSSGIALADTATLSSVGSATTVNRAISVSSGSGTIQNAGSGLLTLSGSLTPNGNTLALKGGSNGIDVSGTLAGSSSNIIIDGGFTTFSGANTFNGTTSLINGSTLTVSGTNALPTANGGSSITMDGNGSGGSTLVLAANQSIASLTGAASSNVTLGSNTLTIGSSTGSSTFASVIGGSGTLVKDGASTLTLSGTSSHSGGTTVNSGTLLLTGSLANGTTSVNSGGTLAGTGTAAAITVNDGGIVAPGTTSGTIGTLSTSSITLAGGGGYNWEISNVAGTPGSQWDLITVSGAATITATSGSPFTIFLRGNPTGWDPTVSQSTGWNIIQWGSVSGFDANAFAVNASYFSGAAPTGSWTFSNAGGYLNLAYAAPSSADIWTAGSGNWSTGANWQSGSVPENGTPLEFAVAGGTSTNNGALTSINGITFGSGAGGSYTINGSSLQIGGGGITNSSAYSQAVSLDLSLTALQTFDSGSANLTFSGNIATSGHRITGAGTGSVTISGAISGLGGLTKTDSGTLVLSANNTYTGTTILSAGTLRLEGSGLLGGGNYSAAISNSGDLILDTSSNQILSGAISGNGSLVKNNSSILTLSGSNTHSGGTTLNAGTLRINNASAIGTGPLVIGGAATIDNTSGSSLILITNNTQNWNSDFTFTCSNNLDLGTGAVAMNATRTLTVSANTLTVGGAISGSGFGLTKNGAGTLVLSGNNSYTGATTIHAGTLTIDANGRLAAGSYSANISNNGTLRFASSLNQTLSGVLSGSGSLIKEGTSTLTLGGANTFTGTITVGAGRLSGNASSLQGNITNDAELEFSETGAAAYSSVISGSGSLIKTGAGNLTLSGAHLHGSHDHFRRDTDSRLVRTHCGHLEPQCQRHLQLGRIQRNPRLDRRVWIDCPRVGNPHHQLLL